MGWFIWPSRSDQWQSGVKTVMDYRVPLTAKNLMTNLGDCQLFKKNCATYNYLDKFNKYHQLQLKYSQFLMINLQIFHPEIISPFKNGHRKFKCNIRAVTKLHKAAITALIHAPSL